MVILRPLARQDFPLLVRWLAEPLVARWWNTEATPEVVERTFGPSLSATDPTDVFLGCSAGVPYGLIQRYPIAAYPEYARELAPVYPVPPAALSVDYLVGEPASRGRGLGVALVAGLVSASWAAFPAAREVLVPVPAGNRSSWRTLERAGFTRVAAGELEPDNPVDSRDHYLYLQPRPVASA